MTTIVSDLRYALRELRKRPGFTLTAIGHTDQILPVSFSEILTQTMHPYSHIVWGALWSGIAMDAVNRARSFVRAEARKTPGETPISAVRLAEVDQVLQEMRHNVKSLTREYQDLLDQNCSEAFKGFGFSIRTNNLKVSCSQRIVEIVGNESHNQFDAVFPLEFLNRFQTKALAHI